MGIGFGELIVILLIVLVVFGAGRLPQIGDALGRSIRNFKKAATNSNEIDVTPRREELPAKPAETTAAKTAETTAATTPGDQQRS